MSSILAQELKGNQVEIVPLLARLANGSLISLDSCIELEIKFYSKIFKQDFYILEQLPEPAILGTDFFRKANLNISSEDSIFPIWKNNNNGLSPESLHYTPFSELVVDFRYLDIYLEESHSVLNEVNEIIELYFNQATIVENNEIAKVQSLETKTFETFKFDIQTEDFNEQCQIKELIYDFKHLFAFKMSDLIGANGVVHQINTGDAPPINQRNYRYGFHENQEIQRQVKDMHDSGVIEHTSSPWNNPIVLVKRDSKYRLCLDFRKLNAVTKVDVYPLPRIDELIHNLEGHHVLSLFDLKSGFWQIPLAEGDKEKTAFTAGHMTYAFKYMPFGLNNAPSTFQRYMNKVFEGLLNVNVGCYIDDVIVYSKTFEEHLIHLRQVFERLDKHDLRVHPEKSSFLCKEVKFLGFIIGRFGIMPDPKRTAAIDKFPRPSKVKDVRSFLGMAGYYRKYIKDFALLANPLTNLLCKNVPFKWDQACEDTFILFKERLTNPPILAHYRVGDPLNVYTDASGIGLGAILNQVQDGVEKTIEYISCTLNKHQMNYSTIEQECLAILWAVKKWRHFLLGTEFKIITDHCNLCWLLRIKDPSGRLARWALLLQEYRFTVVYKNGKAHQNVDPLSRYPQPEETGDCETSIFQIENLDMKAEQMKDTWIKDIKIRIQNNQLKKNENYVLENDILYRNIYDTNGIKRKLLCLPNSLRRDVLTSLHASPISGHVGYVKTVYKVREKVYFPRLEAIVRRFVRSCQDCQSRKNEYGKPKGLMQGVVETEPFALVEMDLIGPFPVTPKRKNSYVILIIDYATRYIEAGAIKDKSAETVANFFVHSIILRHGAVKQVLTDQAQTFCAKFSEEVFRSFNIKHLKSSAYHPQTNGLVERNGRTISDMLALYVDERQTTWDLFIPYLAFAINSARQETTKFSPFHLVYGRDPKYPMDVSFNLPPNFTDVQDIEGRFIEAREMAKIHVSEERMKQKLDYDAKHRDYQFEIGQRVLVFTKKRIVGLSEKLLCNWFGPYEIIKKIGKVTYDCRDLRTGYIDRAHVTRIKPFYLSDIEEDTIWVDSNKDLRTFSEEFSSRPGENQSEEEEDGGRPTGEEEPPLQDVDND